MKKNVVALMWLAAGILGGVQQAYAKLHEKRRGRRAKIPQQLDQQVNLRLRARLPAGPSRRPRSTATGHATGRDTRALGSAGAFVNHPGKGTTGATAPVVPFFVKESL